MLLEDMPYRQNSEITMDWSENGMGSPARIIQKFSEYATKDDSDNEEIVPLDSKQELGHAPHDPAIKAVHMDASVAFVDDVPPIQRTKNPLNTGAHPRRFKLLSKSVVVKPVKSLSRAVNQASSVATGKVKSMRSFLSSLRFPCLSKPDCTA
jgi:hypothetical protein